MDLRFYILVDDCILVANSITEWQGPQRVAEDCVHNSCVSTVFLGMEHMGGMFETMVFGGPIDGYQMRSETASQARENHSRIVSAFNSLGWLKYYLDGNIKTTLLSLINKENNA